MTTKILSSLLLLGLLCACQQKKNPDAQQEILQMMSEYRAAWSVGDTLQILKHISPDITFFRPTKSAPPIYGKQALKKFWFPSASLSYPIIAYEIEHEKVGVAEDLAYYQGLSKLTWCTLENNSMKDTTRSISDFTNILRKENGAWKIYSIMYHLKDEAYTR